MRHALFALTLALGFLVAAPPANAAGSMVITHYAPDNGYAQNFNVRCAANNQWTWVYVGASSNLTCPGGGNINLINVVAGQEIVCWDIYRNGGGWAVWRDATGTHDVGTIDLSCVSQAD